MATFKTRRQKSSSKSPAAKRSDRMMAGNTIGEDVRSVQSMISDEFAEHTYMGCQIVIGSYTDDETGEEEPSFSGMLVFENKAGEEVEATAGISTGQGRDGQTTGRPLHNAIYTAFLDAGGFEADEDDLIDACSDVFHGILENGLLGQEMRIGLFEDTNGDFSDKFFVGKRRIGSNKRRLRGGAASKPAPTNTVPERSWKKADIIAWLHAEGDTAADASMNKDTLMERVDEI